MADHVDLAGLSGPGDGGAAAGDAEVRHVDAPQLRLSLQGLPHHPEGCLIVVEGLPDDDPLRGNAQLCQPLPEAVQPLAVAVKFQVSGGGQNGPPA